MSQTQLVVTESFRLSTSGREAEEMLSGELKITQCAMVYRRSYRSI